MDLALGFLAAFGIGLVIGLAMLGGIWVVSMLVELVTGDDDPDEE